MQATGEVSGHNWRLGRKPCKAGAALASSCWSEEKLFCILHLTIICRSPKSQKYIKHCFCRRTFFIKSFWPWHTVSDGCHCPRGSWSPRKWSLSLWPIPFLLFWCFSICLSLWIRVFICCQSIEGFPSPKPHTSSKDRCPRCTGCAHDKVELVRAGDPPEIKH